MSRHPTPAGPGLAPGGLNLAGQLHLALRNLGRNPRRTALTLLASVLGVAALALLAALNDGWLAQMQANFILTLTGHVQVHARGFEASQSLRDRLPDPAALAPRIEADPAVAAWTARVRGSGLASLGGMSVGVQLLGVDPVREPGVSRLAATVREGTWLGPDGHRDLLLGAQVAANLGARPGDRVVLTAQGPDGAMSAEVFVLRGVLQSGAPQIDRTLALVPLAGMQRWLGLGEAVTDLVLRAVGPGQSQGLRERLTAALPGDCEVLTWRDLDPMVSQWLRFSDAYGLVLILVVAALVLVQVLNTMLMALHERTRELGIMAALGTPGRQLFNLVLLEGLLLILAGALLGYLLGAGLVLGLARDGIDLSRFASALQFFYMSPVIRPVLTLESGLRILGTTLAAALLAGLYPAWRAGRLSIPQALRRL